MRYILTVIFVVFLAGIWAGVSAPEAFFWTKKTQTKTETVPYQLETVVSGFDYPWSLAFLPQGDLLVTEREGHLYRVDGKTKQKTSVENLPPIVAKGQGGLLDVVLHPHFAENQLIYLSHVVPVDEAMTLAVTRARLDGARLKDKQEIFRLPKPSRSTVHFGSRMAFDDTGYLYISVGERGDRPRAQDLSDPAGAILRLHDDGRIPEDNPFYGVETAHGAIYSYGHRNPQGMAVHPQTRKIWVHEHGPRGGDEVNLIKAGANYGWPVITFGKEYTLPKRVGKGTQADGVEAPLTYWAPSIAPSGMAFYTGKDFPQWENSLFVGALAGAHVARLTVTKTAVTGEVKLLEAWEERIRDIRQGPDGKIYIVPDAVDAAIMRLVPKP